MKQTDETKDILQKHEKLWNKFRGLIRSISNIADNFDEKYMKIKFNSDDNCTLELHNMVNVSRSDLHEGNKYYPQVFLDEYYCKS